MMVVPLAPTVASLLLWLPFQGPQQATPPLAPQARRAVVDSVAAVLRSTYVFPDTGALMAERVRGRLAAGAYDTVATGPALAAAIGRDLMSVHHDPHLRIVYDAAEARRIADTTRREAPDRLPVDRRNNFYFHDLRILPGNIGYLEFTQFADTSAEARETVRAAMRYVVNASALILDLRDNRGGSAAMAREIASYFIQGRDRWSDGYNRLANAWTEGWFENRPEVTGGLSLAMPVTVLTSSWTFSAAEGLAYGLQHNRSARVVGERTGGGAHVVRRVGLGNGFVGFIPYTRSVNIVTGTDWEGVGVEPDVAVSAPDALLRARTDILERRLPAAGDSAAVRRIAWAINAARADEAPAHPPAATLQRYVGRLEEYVFEQRGGDLYATNTSRANKLTRMRAITETLFRIDAESQIEFVTDSSGAYTHARLLWDDGAVDELTRRRQ